MKAHARLRRVIVLASIVGSTLAPHGASAEIAQCAGGSTYGFRDGFETAPDPTDLNTYIIGAVATIQIRNAYTCTSDTDTSTNHVYAIAGVSGSAAAPNVGLGWARVGYRRYVGTPTHYFFAEWTLNGFSIYREAFAPTAGTSATATVEWYGACQCLRMRIGSWIKQSQIDPQTDWDTSTIWAEYESFAKYTQSDVPGNTAVRTQYSNLQIDTLGLGFHPLNPIEKARTYPRNANVRWSQSTGITSDNKFQIWCSSIDCR